MFVSAGSASTHATSPCASARSSASASFHSTTRVVSSSGDRRAEIAFALHDASVRVERCERLVDGSVVAPVEDEHLRPAGDVPREPDREPVRIGCGQRELPPLDPESPRELVRDHECILARKHERDAARRLVGNRPHRRLGRMPGHGTGVAEAEVHVLEPVDVAEAGTLRLDGEHRKAARPPHHPVHRHARRGATREPSPRARASAGAPVRTVRAPLGELRSRPANSGKRARSRATGRRALPRRRRRSWDRIACRSSVRALRALLAGERGSR